MFVLVSQHLGKTVLPADGRSVGLSDKWAAVHKVRGDFAFARSRTHHFISAGYCPHDFEAPLQQFRAFDGVHPPPKRGFRQTNEAFLFSARPERTTVQSVLERLTLLHDQHGGRNSAQRSCYSLGTRTIARVHPLKQPLSKLKIQVSCNGALWRVKTDRNNRTRTSDVLVVRRPTNY